MKAKVQVLHELPSAEAFFTRYVLTGTPVASRQHVQHHPQGFAWMIGE
jgi:hypothetical protein